MNELITLQSLTEEQRENLQQIVVTAAGLSALWAQMDARITALEQEKTQATILHKDALIISRMIREKADGEAYAHGLDTHGAQLLRGMLKRQVLSRYGIRDLHDLPKCRYGDCTAYIGSWLSYLSIKKVREKLRHA